MEALQINKFSEYLKARPHDCHKGDFGRVVVVGGDFGFSGAVRLAGEAALRVGAGLVSIATRMEYATVLNVSRPELMCHGIGFANEMSELVDAASVVVIGPGLGKEGWGQELFEYVVHSKKLLIVDADGLNILAERNKPLQRENWILTPHPGEAARLLNISGKEVQNDRVAALKKLHEKFGGVIVLKGAGSLVIGANSKPAICEAGNPGMATAGMGDVLSGVIGGLLAQHVPLLDAAKMGVLLHAMAADLARDDGERGMIASDLMPYLRRLVNGNSE